MNRCYGFMTFNTSRYREAKESGEKPGDYRAFTAESGRLWSEMSNAQQAIHDLVASTSEWCRAKARRKAMTDDQKLEADCEECRQKCAKYMEKAAAMEKKAAAMERRSQEGPQPLSPFMSFSQAKRSEYTGNPIARARALGAAWRALSEDERKSWESDEYRAWRQMKKAEKKTLSSRFKKKPGASDCSSAQGHAGRDGSARRMAHRAASACVRSIRYTRKSDGDRKWQEAPAASCTR